MPFSLNLTLLAGTFLENSSPIMTPSSLISFVQYYLRSQESNSFIVQPIVPRQIDLVREQIKQLKLYCNFLYTPLITSDFGPRSCFESRPSSTILFLLQSGKPLMRWSKVSLCAIFLTFWLPFLLPTPWSLVLTL